MSESDAPSVVAEKNPVAGEENTPIQYANGGNPNTVHNGVGKAVEDAEHHLDRYALPTIQALEGRA